MRRLLITSIVALVGIVAIVAITRRRHTHDETTEA
mgnify:CR=1 FL=1